MTRASIQHADDWLREALDLSDGQELFPWQARLLRRLVDGTMDRALDLPTGLGKTAVMAIWAVARAVGAPVPRRLVYVVDRRAVVDQATAVAEGIRAWVARTPEAAEGMAVRDGELPISTLRGQFVDNREWLDDPSVPAIIVGTVDMIGSRLLFEGYGVSRKMRPYQAGLLGSDTLFVLDEAHLVPPFERLIEAIANGTGRFGPKKEEDRALIPPLRVLSLSATGRDHGDQTFRLDAKDADDQVVERRLRATKRLTVERPVAAKSLPETLAARAWDIAEDSDDPIRCIVFTSKRADAEKVAKELDGLAKKARGKRGDPVSIELFVGGRRVRERMTAAETLSALGFIAGAAPTRNEHAFLVATSAGEVGVDLDADHMVADLVAWERMVQRLGRVNRRGNGDAQVVVFPSDGPLQGCGAEAAEAVQRLLTMLPRHADGSRDASPAGIATVTSKAAAREDLEKGTTPAPLHPPLDRPVVDAWAMTSLREHTGRPEVAPWLRGWVDVDPRTSVLWRTHLSRVAALGKAVASRFIDAAPPHTSEMLEDKTDIIVDWLLAAVTRLIETRAREVGDEGNFRSQPVACVLGRANELEDVLTVASLDVQRDPRKKKSLYRRLRGATLVVDATVGGLTSNGLLDHAVAEPPPTADAAEGESKWLTEGKPPVIRFRIREEVGDPGRPEGAWRARDQIDLERRADEEVVRWLVIDRWFTDTDTEEDRSTAAREQALDEHQEWAESCARVLAERMGLSRPHQDMLAVAARLHDEGKQAERWQRAFHAPRDGKTYAKTRGPVNARLLGGYRHEFGSLGHAERSGRLQSLRGDLRELALHLIASHHGFARPLLRVDGCDDAPPSVLEARARAAALRYVQLQERWGPWGLAFWESLLRAADQQASRRNDAGEEMEDK